MCFRCLPQRQGSVERRLDASGPDLLQPPFQILNIRGHRTTKLLLAKEEVPNVKGHLRASRKSEGDDDTERSHGFDTLGQN